MSSRPPFAEIRTAAEFNRWYWLKAELTQIAKELGLGTGGRKFDIQSRIGYHLDHPGKPMPEPPTKRIKSTFNWSKEKLSLTTVITDNISFGQNFRAFMQEHVEGKFTCHTDFMAWAKANSGKTLRQAVDQYNLFERRKLDPTFRREIATSNMYNQYTRDFFDAHPDKTVADARACWLRKKSLPTDNGVVRYAPEDLKLVR